SLQPVRGDREHLVLILSVDRFNGTTQRAAVGGPGRKPRNPCPPVACRVILFCHGVTEGTIAVWRQQIAVRFAGQRQLERKNGKPGRTLPAGPAVDGVDGTHHLLQPPEELEHADIVFVGPTRSRRRQRHLYLVRKVLSAEGPGEVVMTQRPC